MKVYTKTGDNGETSLIGGSRVQKFHPRIEAYGTVDELNSFIGLIRDLCDDENTKKQLITIQHKLFSLESHLALEPDTTKHQYNCATLPTLDENDILFLEKNIDLFNEKLPELTNFILPGGHILVSYCHIARTICRRAERITLKLASESEVESVLIKYLNRLSDYLFVLARYFSLTKNGEEIIWDTKL